VETILQLNLFPSKIRLVFRSEIKKKKEKRKRKRKRKGKGKRKKKKEMAGNGCYINSKDCCKNQDFYLIQNNPGFCHFTPYVRVKLHGFHILVFSLVKAPHFSHKKPVIVVKRRIIRVQDKSLLVFFFGFG
jgi:hypothetical protein